MILSQGEHTLLRGAKAAKRQAELQEIIADMNDDDFKRLLSLLGGIGYSPEAEDAEYTAEWTAISGSAELWVNGMTQAEITATYGYASTGVIASKIRSSFHCATLPRGMTWEGESGAGAGTLA